MLTVDYGTLGLRAGDRLLDLGCGAGRHAFEALRRGARVTAFDYDEAELKDVAALRFALGVSGNVMKRRVDQIEAERIIGKNERLARILEHHYGLALMAFGRDAMAQVLCDTH